MTQLNKLFAVALAVGAPLSAQILTGPGRETGPTLPVETIVTSNGCLGVAYLNGELYVSSRGNNGGAVAPHTMYVIDPVAGTLTRSFPQAASTSTSAWGFRDGATDGTSLIFGSEGGLEVFDPNGVPVNTLNAVNGPQPIVTPLPITATGLWRGLAYDPAGNGGNGSFFTGSFGTAIFEIDLQGNVLNTFPNSAAPNDWSTYGLALDPSGTTLWVYSVPNQGVVREFLIDRTNSTLTPTGREFDNPQGAAAQGGLALVPGSAEGRNCGYDLAVMTQTTPDSVSFHRLDLWDNFSSMNEWPLVTGIDAGARDGFAKTVSLGSNTSFELEVIAPPGTAYVMFMEFGPFTPRAVGPYFGVFPSAWELRLNALTASVAWNSALPAFTLATLSIPAAFGGDISIQAISPDPLGMINSIVPCGLQLPLQFSNVCTLTIVP